MFEPKKTNYHDDNSNISIDSNTIINIIDDDNNIIISIDSNTIINIIDDDNNIIIINIDDENYKNVVSESSFQTLFPFLSGVGWVYAVAGGK